MGKSFIVVHSYIFLFMSVTLVLLWVSWRKVWAKTFFFFFIILRIKFILLSFYLIICYFWIVYKIGIWNVDRIYTFFYGLEKYSFKIGKSSYWVIQRPTTELIFKGLLFNDLSWLINYFFGRNIVSIWANPTSYESSLSILGCSELEEV